MKIMTVEKIILHVLLISLNWEIIFMNSLFHRSRIGRVHERISSTGSQSLTDILFSE